MDDFYNFKEKSYTSNNIKLETERKNYVTTNDFKEISDKVIYSTEFTQKRYEGIPKLNMDDYNIIKNDISINPNQCKEIENTRTNIGYRANSLDYNDDYNSIRYNSNDRIKEKQRKKENQIIYDKNIYNETDAYKPLIVKMVNGLDTYSFPKQTRKKDFI
jgi:hypothetical protein